MASISSPGLWIHDADDLADFIWLPYLADVSVTPAKEGQLVELAGGRLVYRGRPTVRQTWTGRARIPNRTDRERLAGWVGRPVMIRDGVGNLLFGVFHQAPTVELKGIDQRDVTLTVEALTMTAEV